ncbi:protein of unknown function [Sterolibacterium denitrificans]|uniref:NAD-dependent epimerase/dehydratase domain-containing protein n=1 Tax=Sterolibacterium denitrificans TaxID=157592 RepID=A0A7Z7HPP3_9PROT|nr:NAD(P)-dependent oxidoreductase [Sterolibacterium denitrificans]SMB23219.1 protein of unknown function [Sterolibacterium denitrificans]
MAGHLVLTGATGYLGHAVLDELRRTKRTSGFDRITATFHRHKVTSSAPSVPSVEFLSFAELLHGSFDFGDVDIVCHLGVPRVKPDDPQLASSVTDLQLLLIKAANAGVRGFIYASSQAVYGVTRPVWHESSPLAPVTAHGWGKLAGEQLVKTVSESLSDLTGISLRLPKLIGPGSGFRMNQGEWVHALVHAALQGRKISLSQQFLAQQFDFMDVRDAASVITCILARPPKTWPKVLNIGLGSHMTGKELIAVVSEFCEMKYNKPLRYDVEASPLHSRNFGMDVTALSEYLNGFSKRALEDTIADICEFVIGH